LPLYLAEKNLLYYRNVIAKRRKIDVEKKENNQTQFMKNIMMEFIFWKNVKKSHKSCWLFHVL